MPFVSSDPRSAANGNYTTSQQIASLYGYPMGYMGAVRLTAAQRREQAEAKRVAAQAQRQAAQAQRQAAKPAGKKYWSIPAGTLDPSNGVVSASEAIVESPTQPTGGVEITAQEARKRTAALKAAVQQANRAQQQAQQQANRAALQSQQQAKRAAAQAQRTTAQSQQQAKRAELQSQQQAKRAAQQTQRAEQQAARVAGRPAKLTAAQRKDAQAAKKAAQLGVQCQPGETPKKCHGTAMCLKAGEKCGGGKGAPKKVSPQQDEALKAQMQAQAKQSCDTLKSAYEKLKAKFPGRATKFWQKHGAAIQKCGATPPPAATAGRNKPALARRPAKKLRGFFGLGGFSAMGSMGSLVCGDGVTQPDASGLCLDGTSPVESGSALPPLGGSMPAGLPAMVNTPPPKGCDRNPNKPVCMFYQMSTQMQSFMYAIMQMIQQNQQIMMELMAEINAGGDVGGGLAQCEAGYIMDINGNCVPSGSGITGCPPGMVLDAMGNCISGGQQCPAGVDPNTGLCYPTGQISPYAQQYPTVDPYGGQMPYDMSVPPQAPQMQYADYGGGPAVESLPGMEATGMETMIPAEVRPSEMYAGGGYAPPPGTTPDVIPAGFDVGEADMFGAGGGTQIPVEMPVSQTVGMPMFVQPSQGGGMPTTDSFSAAELVAGPFGEEQFVPYAQEYQPQMVEMPQAAPMLMAPQAPMYPYPGQQYAQATIPEAPQGYLPQQYAEMPAPEIAPLPYGAPRGYQPPVTAMQPQLPAGVLPQQPLEVVAPENMSPELIQMPAGDIYGATIPVQGQAEILASMTPGEEPLEVQD